MWLPAANASVLCAANAGRADKQRTTCAPPLLTCQGGVPLPSFEKPPLCLSCWRRRARPARHMGQPCWMAAANRSSREGGRQPAEGGWRGGRGSKVTRRQMASREGVPAPAAVRSPPCAVMGWCEPGRERCRHGACRRWPGLPAPTGLELLPYKEGHVLLMASPSRPFALMCVPPWQGI